MKACNIRELLWRQVRVRRSFDTKPIEGAPGQPPRPTGVRFTAGEEARVLNVDAETRTATIEGVKRSVFSLGDRRIVRGVPIEDLEVVS